MFSGDWPRRSEGPSALALKRKAVGGVVAGSIDSPARSETHKPAHFSGGGKCTKVFQKKCINITSSTYKLRTRHLCFRTKPVAMAVDARLPSFCAASKLTKPHWKLLGCQLTVGALCVFQDRNFSEYYWIYCGIERNGFSFSSSSTINSLCPTEVESDKTR